MRTVTVKFYYHTYHPDSVPHERPGTMVYPVREDIARELEEEYASGTGVFAASENYTVAGLMISYALQLETGERRIAYIDRVEIIRPHTLPYGEAAEVGE